MSTDATVRSVSLSESHTFTKKIVDSIELLEGLGVKGDAHCGETVKHRSRLAKDPTQPNLRQVHLIHSELLDELAEQGRFVACADLGENVTTSGIDLLGLCRGARLLFSQGPIIELTGLRNPCAQIESFQKGLLSAVLDRDSSGQIVRKAGVMGIVIRGGQIQAGDRIDVQLPDGPPLKLEKV
ncbi:MAG: MOSC domain-containing protein [Pseudomonadales bacterium]